jgi:UDP-glucose 4-epimerase
LNILLTGGLGYIGSHTAVTLASAGHAVVLLDNLCNSTTDVLDRLERVVGGRIPFVQCDVRDTAMLEGVLRARAIDAVIHFAGLKAVAESVAQPIEYYGSNVQGALSLLQAMASTGARTLVFSSSATVYGEPRYLPLDEAHPLSATNPYGRTKLHVEQMLADVAAADSSWRIACLRYFNPVGGHDSGLLGDRPSGTPNNLMPAIVDAASGRSGALTVHGHDYDTRDGTGVRDYVHVMDLAEGHAAAVRYLASHQGWHAFNLGTGQGCSVLDIVRTFEAVSGAAVPYKLAGRRPGDVDRCWADASKAGRELGWTARRTLADMCASAWRFHTSSESETS